MNDSPYAGFWLRFVAFIIDYLIIEVCQSFLIIPFLASFGITFEVFDYRSLMSAEDLFVLLPALISMMASLALLAFLIKLLYYSLMESSKHQATIGKLAVGIKVTDMDGDRLDFTKAMIRQLGKILSGFILFFGYIMAGLTAKKQALHDVIAGTLVVKK